MCLLHILNKTYILISLRVIGCYSEPKLWHGSYVLSYVFALWFAPIAIYWLLWVVVLVRVNLQGGNSKLSQEKWQRQMHQTHIISSQPLDWKKKTVCSQGFQLHDSNTSPCHHLSQQGAENVKCWYLNFRHIVKCCANMNLKVIIAYCYFMST